MEAQSWSQRLKIVAETSGHPSHYRWTTGERASSRDAHNTKKKNNKGNSYKTEQNPIDAQLTFPNVIPSLGGP